MLFIHALWIRCITDMWVREEGRVWEELGYRDLKWRISADLCNLLEVELLLDTELVAGQLLHVHSLYRLHLRLNIYNAKRKKAKQIMLQNLQIDKIFIQWVFHVFNNLWWRRMEMLRNDNHSGWRCRFSSSFNPLKKKMTYLSKNGAEFVYLGVGRFQLGSRINRVFTDKWTSGRLVLIIFMARTKTQENAILVRDDMSIF